MNKKGISPLIATVLIIGFVVALAAIVMVFSSDFVKDQEESATDQSKVLKCTEADFEITCCYTVEDSIKQVFVENKGSLDLYPIFRGNSGGIKYSNRVAEPFEIKYYKFSEGEIKGDSITVIARMNFGNEFYSCGEIKDELKCQTEACVVS